MTLIKDGAGISAVPLNASMPDTRVIDEPERPAPWFSEGAAAAWRQADPVGVLLWNETSGLNRFDIEEGFNAPSYARAAWGEAFEAEHGDKFIDVFNRRYADALKAQIDRENEDRKTVEAAGTVGALGEMAFSLITDPTNLLPGGQIVRAARKGRAFMSSAARVGAAGAGAAALSEAMLQSGQATRTHGESALAIGASTTLSGILGGTIGGGRPR